MVDKRGFLGGMIWCPVCREMFIKRRSRRCIKCKTALYIGREYLYDRNGFWWDGNNWIPVKEFYNDSE